MVAPAPKGAIQNCPLSEWPQEKVSGAELVNKVHLVLRGLNPN